MWICAEPVGIKVKLFQFFGLIGLTIKVINSTLLPLYFFLDSLVLSPLLDSSRFALDLDLLDLRLRLEDDRPLWKVTFGFLSMPTGWLLDRPRFRLSLLAALVSSSSAWLSFDFFFDD